LHRNFTFMNKFLFWALLSTICFSSCNNNTASTEDSDNNPVISDVPPLNYSIVNSYPHDTSAYTEGLLFHDGKLYESTGGSPKHNRFKSWMAQVNLKTGKPVKQVFLDSNYFGEGITIFNNKIYQLTYEEKKVFVYDLNTFKKIQEFSWDPQGWGITHDNKNLILSDGSSNLYIVDPSTFKMLSITGVKDNYGPVGDINELEYINGFIYANKYTTDYIYKIDPTSGKVLAKADLSGVLAKNAPEWSADPKFQPGNTDGVLNGIAYDSATGKIYITGKLWPKIFEIKFN
jgi:glutaminyl-peptide cyclotransferase